MRRLLYAGALTLALTLPAGAQPLADVFAPIEAIGVDGTVRSADWYRNGASPGAVQPNQSGGGTFFVVAAGPDITTLEAAAGRWLWNNRAGIAGNTYEIRFTSETQKAAEYFSGALRDAPFEVWLLGTTPDDPSDDVRMIPRVLDRRYFTGEPENPAFDFGDDHLASDGADDPYSDWIYFALPADRSPGEAGYDQFVADGALDPATTATHLARVTLMNWNRRQGESAPGAGDGPADARPEPGTTFRIRTLDVVPPECVVTAFEVGSPITFTLEVNEPVSGVASVTQRTLTNATVSYQPVEPGSTAPLVIDGTITNRFSGVVRLDIEDGAGNAAVCDKPRMSEVAIHDAGNVVLAMQPNSSFGTFDTSIPTTSGVSAFWPKVGGVSHLFDAGLWVAGGQGRVVDNVYSNRDWSPTPGAPITYASTVGDQDIGLTYDDRNAGADRLGLRVHQQSFQWGSADLEDVVVLKYTFENTGLAGDLTGLYPALWTDTDISPTYKDLSGFDAGTGMVYGHSEDGTGGYVGIKVIGSAAHAHAAYANGEDPGTSAEKHDVIVNGRGVPSAAGDHRMVVTAPPFDLPVGAVRTVTFAMVLGADLADLRANAAEAETAFATTLSDDDDDGVPSSTEGGVPNPDGSGTGDGNGDGIPDVDQANVTSLPNGVDGNYVTFASDPGTTLIGVVATADVPAPDEAPAEATFPSGFLSFGLNGLAPGAATTLTVYPRTPVDSYWKYGPTPDDPEDHWYEFDYDGETGAEIFPDRVVLHFVDGKRGDADLEANGRIQDPGAPVTTAPSSASGGAPEGPVGVGQPYPNPTAGSSAVDVSLAGAAEVEVQVVDLLGRVVQTARHELAAGTHAVALPVGGLARGVYVVHVRARLAGATETAFRRVTVIR